MPRARVELATLRLGGKGLTLERRGVGHLIATIIPIAAYRARSMPEKTGMTNQEFSSHVALPIPETLEEALMERKRYGVAASHADRTYQSPYWGECSRAKATFSLLSAAH